MKPAFGFFGMDSDLPTEYIYIFAREYVKAFMCDKALKKKIKWSLYSFSTFESNFSIYQKEITAWLGTLCQPTCCQLPRKNTVLPPS